MNRFSIHPESVEHCRRILMSIARNSGIDGAEEEVESLPDWEAVKKVETLVKNTHALTKALQGATRAASGLAAQFAATGEALLPLAAENSAQELELFLAIDHSA